MSYDPTVGRWLEEDPLGFDAGDPNLYRYVGNDPTDETDPSGLDELAVNAQTGIASWNITRPGDHWWSSDVVVRSVPIGNVASGNYIQIDAQFGGGVVPRSSLARTISDRTSRNLADESASSQNSFIAGVLQGYSTTTQQPSVQTQSSAPVRYVGAVGLGAAQGAVNSVNGAQDVVIGLVNILPGTYNFTLGWVTPNLPYIPSPDWSRNLITEETNTGHAVSRGAGAVAFTAGTGATVGYIATAGQAGAGAQAAAVVVRPLGLGSTGRTLAATLQEQLAMQQVISNPLAGTVCENLVMGDPRWPANEGWVKMKQTINGIIIHYVRNTITGAVDDFKFVD